MRSVASQLLIVGLFFTGLSACLVAEDTTPLPSAGKAAAAAKPTHNSIVKGAHVLFASDVGGQGYAIYEELVSLGDLVEITSFGRALPAPLVGELTAGDIRTNADLALISALSSETAKTINELRDYLTTVRQQLQTAGNGPAAIGKVLDDLVAKPAPIDPAIAKYVRNPQEFRAQVFHAFAPAIVTRLANAELAGASVTKGSAVVDAASGTAVVGLSIKIDLPGAQPAGSSNAKVIKTDAEGKFAVQGTGVATLTISGPDVVSQEQEVRLSEAPFNWTADTWNELEEDQQWQITDSLDALYLRLSEGFAWPEDLPEDAAERKAAATKIAETIRRTYQQTAARRSVVSEGVLKAFATPETFSPVATLLSEQGTTAAFKPLLVEHRQGEQVPAGQPMPKPFRAAALPVQPKLDAIAVELEQPAANLDLTDSLVKAVQGAAPANSTVQVKKIRSQAMKLPDGRGGTSTIQILEVSVVSAIGAPRKADPVQLQKNLNELADGNDQIRFAEVSLPREAEVGPPKDPHYTSRGSWGKKYYDQWALRRVSLQQGKTEWPTVLKEIKPENQCIVAVIGSGVDWTHSELLGQMWQNSAEDPYNGMDDDGNGYVDDQFGYNFRDNNFKVLDKGGHDTHVAGVIAARWNQQGIAGINPQAKIMALKIANYLGQANSVDISRAIFYAVDQGAQVINISYGGGQPSRIEQRAIDYAASNNVLVVVAAGNKASDASKYALASCRGVLTVAGTTVEDTRAPFSNWGQAVDLSAPAMDVLALRARDTDFLVYTGVNPDYQGGSAVVGKSQDLYRASGTSFAAPLVAGAASLLRSSRPELSAQQVKQMLIMSAEDVETPGWDQFTGSGVLNIQQAVKADPDYFLFARISEVKAVRKENKISIQVLGQVSGSSLAKYQLQVGFGASPDDGDWMTVSTGEKAVPDGQLGTLPLTRFNRKGAWTIRLLVTDKQGKSRQARATLNLN